MPPDLPATVTVSAPDSASVSSLIDLHCESAPSFPAPSLKWRIVDQMEELVKEVDAEVEEQEDGGFVAISDLRWVSSGHCPPFITLLVVEGGLLGRLGAKLIQTCKHPSPSVYVCQQLKL